MAKKFLVNLDLGGNQLNFARIQNAATASAPTAFGKGQIWYDSTLNILKVYNGTSWDSISTGGGSFYLGTTSISLGNASGSVTTIAGLSSVTSTSFVGALTGNASTATTLATSRNINGVAFNGSADITVTAAAGTLTGATLNSGVTASSLTSVGTIATGVWNGTAITTSYGGTGLTTYTGGDLLYYSTGTTLSKLGIGTTNYVLTSSGSAPQYVAQSTLSVGSATNATNTAITDDTATATAQYLTWVGATSGNNAQKVSSSKLTFIPSTGTLAATLFSGSGASLTNIPNSATTATSTNTNSAIVARDGSGNFSATTISAALSGNATTATTLATARTINGTSFDGSANITVTAAAGTLTGVTLNSSVTASSLTSVGTLSGLTATGTVNLG
jgi:hypothetical protein